MASESQMDGGRMMYEAYVVSFHPGDGSITCSVPQLYGTNMVTALPMIRRRSDVALIDPMLPGDTAYVFFTGGDQDHELFWLPTIVVA